MSVLLIPRISEKAYNQSQKLNVYLFDVPMSANKITIKQAVEKEYDVVVTNVRTLVQNGKNARSIRIKNQRGRPVMGTRPDVKKAYVTLAEGNEIPVFAEAAESEEA